MVIRCYKSVTYLVRKAIYGVLNLLADLYVIYLRRVLGLYLFMAYGVPCRFVYEEILLRGHIAEEGRPSLF